MKTVDAKVNKDVDRLTDDLSRLRDDVKAILWSIRSRAKDRAKRTPEAAVDLAGQAPATEVYVEEPELRPRRMIVKRSRMSARRLVGFLAVGAVAALFLSRRRATRVVALPPGRRWLRFSRGRAAVVTERPLRP